jgi:hypothetical protein
LAQGASLHQYIDAGIISVVPAFQEVPAFCRSGFLVVSAFWSFQLSSRSGFSPVIPVTANK